MKLRIIQDGFGIYHVEKYGWSETANEGYWQLEDEYKPHIGDIRLCGYKSLKDAEKRVEYLKKRNQEPIVIKEYDA